MWLSTEKYRGYSILFQQLVVTLPLKAVRSKVFRTDTAVLRGLKVFPTDSCLPFFAKTGSSKRKLVERNGLILIIPVLAAVGGTGLHHPSGLQSLHFYRSRRQEKLLSMSPRWALTPSLLL